MKKRFLPVAKLIDHNERWREASLHSQNWQAPMDLGEFDDALWLLLCKVEPDEEVLQYARESKQRRADVEVKRRT
jgi:hypothetical protein